jgi:hypothetical protein
MQMCIIYSVYVRFIDHTLHAVYASNKFGNLKHLCNYQVFLPVSRQHHINIASFNHIEYIRQGENVPDIKYIFNYYLQFYCKVCLASVMT